MTDKNQQLPCPIPQMTTFELRNLRQELETVLSTEPLPEVYEPRERDLRQQLDAVIAEQESRKRIARAC